MARAKVLLWGGKSQSHIVDEMLKENGIGRTVAIFDASLDAVEFASDAFFTKNIDELRDNLHLATHFVAGIGGQHGYARYMTGEHLKRIGLQPLSVIHDKSFIDPTSTIGEACQIMPFAVVHKFGKIGGSVLLNTGCTIDHDCIIGNGVHIMGRAAIAGKVTIGDYATIGTNATILPFVTIGEGAYIGAGAVVTKDVLPYTVVAGVPARHLKAHVLAFNSKLLESLSFTESRSPRQRT